MTPFQDLRTKSRDIALVGWCAMSSSSAAEKLADLRAWCASNVPEDTPDHIVSGLVDAFTSNGVFSLAGLARVEAADMVRLRRPGGHIHVAARVGGARGAPRVWRVLEIRCIVHVGGVRAGGRGRGVCFFELRARARRLRRRVHVPPWRRAREGAAPPRAWRTADV